MTSLPFTSREESLRELLDECSYMCFLLARLLSPETIQTKINEPKTPYHGPLGDQHMEDVDDGMQPLELDSHPQQHPAPSLEVSSAGDDDPCTGEQLIFKLHPKHQGSTVLDLLIPNPQNYTLLGSVSRWPSAMLVWSFVYIITGPGPTHPFALDFPDAELKSVEHLSHPTGAAREAVAKEDAAPDTLEAAKGGAAAEEANGCSASVAAGPSGSSDHKHVHGHGHHAHFQPSLVLEDVAGEPENRSGFSSDSERRISLTGGSDGELNEEEARRKFEQRRRAHYNMRAALRRARMLMSEDEDEDEQDSDSEDGQGRTAMCSADAATNADATMSDGGKQARGDLAAS
ncbi:hypothetical protein Vafri_14216 [Volvox africanus]|uniref:Protein phosphatase inhibitor 2 n=1 Tax=Volvox africanus TaxID=51714 RepID=A0A8J4F6E9_9CHLO|nr:hypothetical protein Vafri_14216 [Volvox africanus]